MSAYTELKEELERKQLDLEVCMSMGDDPEIIESKQAEVDDIKNRMDDMIRRSKAKLLYILRNV